MEITLTTGVLMYTLDDGSTGYINLTNDVIIEVLTGSQYHFGGAVNSPNALEGNAPTTTTNYTVRLHLVGRNYPFDMAMGEIGNQSTWVNTQDGANICASDIAAVLA